MDARSGIFRAILCQAGTLNAATTGIVPVGVRKTGTFKISPFNSSADYRGRKLRSMMNFRFQGTSYQCRLRDLEWLILFIQSKFDAQIAMNKQSAGAASGGIFNLTDGEWGLDWEYVVTEKERYTDIIIEKAMEYENAITFIDGADGPASLLPSIAADWISGGNERGENFANYAAPWYLGIEAPGGVEIFAKDEIKSRKFSLKTKGTKNGYNKTIVDYITVTLEVVATNATISKMVELLSKDMSPSLTIKENLTAATYEKHIFSANVLSHEEEFDLDDNKRLGKITFYGDLSLDQFAFAYGDTNGGIGLGTTDDSKTTGGTLSI